MRPEPTTPTPRADWLARRLAATPSELERLALQVREPKRSHSRHATRNLQIDSPVFGWVVDVSESGLGAESVAPLVAGGSYVFRLRYGATFLNLPGRVVWSRLERTERNRRGPIKIYRAGIELAPTDPAEDWLQAIERLTGAALRS